MDGRTDGRMDAWMDGWMDGWMIMMNREWPKCFGPLFICKI